MKPNTSMRQAKCTVEVGVRGAGKTTFALDMIEKIGRPGLILTSATDDKLMSLPTISIDTDFSGLGEGAPPVQLIDFDSLGEDVNEGVKHGFNLFYKYLRNCTLFVDDAAGVIPAAPQRYMYKFINNIRHASVDLILNYHSISNIPIWMLGNINYIVVFKSGNFDEKKAKRMPNCQELIEMHARVQKHKNPYYFEILQVI